MLKNIEKAHDECYRFDDVVMDCQNFRIQKQGAAQPLAPRAFDVLRYLIEQRGRVVEKQELFENIWQDSFVTDDALTRAVKEIRRALGDDATAPRYVETVPKRGYRFIAELQEAEKTREAETEKIAPPVITPPALTQSTQSAELEPVSLLTIKPAFLQRQRSQLLLGLLVSLVIIASAGWLYAKRQPALTEKDTIVLADFTNQTGDAVFDGTLKQGLATQLEQSRFLNIFPEVRVRQTLQQMERAVDTRVTAEIAQEICERQNLKAFIVGSIAPLGSHYVITLAGLRGSNGEELARTQATATSKEQVLQALSEAVARLRAQLGESLSSIQQSDQPLAQATTSDLRALKAYSEGSALMTSGRFVEALPFVRRAAELDPQFAAAYDYLTLICLNTEQPEAAAAYATKATQLFQQKAAQSKDSVSEFSRLGSAGWYHRLVTGNQSKQLESLLPRRQLAPRAAPAQNDLGASYNSVGQSEQALAPLHEAIRLNPNFAAPYRVLTQALIRLNRFAEAKDTLTQALQLKLEFTAYHTQLYQLAFIGGDAAGMQQQLDWSRGQPDEYVALDWQTSAAAFAGQWRQAQDFSRRAIELAVRGDNREVAARYATEQALRSSAVLGNCQTSKTLVANGLAFGRGRLPLARAALALALCGAVSQSQTLADELTKRFPEDTLSQEIWLPVIRAALKLQSGTAAQAIEQLRNTSRYEAAAEFWPQYLRGQAYSQLKQGPQAAAEFQKILDHRGYAPLSPLYPLAQLGLAHAMQNRKAYDDFLASWKEADVDLPVLLAAKKEYETVK
jgi:eukaryotic-like serine/threonine-protein kinase